MAHCEAYPAFYGAERHAGLNRNLGLRKPAKKRKFDDGSLLRIECLERIMDIALNVTLHDYFLGS